MAAINERVNSDQVVTILQSLNYTQSQINSIVSQITSEIGISINQIDINQFQQLLQPIEQEIPTQKLTSEQIYAIYAEFRQALHFQNIEKVRQILTTYQKDIDLVNRIDPQTRQISTFIAIVGSDEDISLQLLKYLCELGANINYKDNLKQSILFYICRDGRTKLFDFLVSQGINISDTDSYGQTPLFYASRENRIDIISRFIKLGGDIAHLDTLSCQTALFYAASKGHYEACKLLIEAGCPVNHQDNKKKTALYFAKQSQKKEVIDLITASMQKQKEDVHQKKEESVKGGEQKQNKKKQKEVPKQQYKILHTDDKGQQRELTNEDFQQFSIQYPEIASLILNADDFIDENMINQCKEDETWEKQAKKIIAQIWKAKGAYFFHKPVDQKEFHITDYFEIVKKPMDFGTIKNKLNVNAYKNFREFHADMLLVFDNCVLYNGNQSAIGQIGVSIKSEYLSQVEQNGLNKYL
ncbi:unnamed protein product (macronuclear) [Paramecium tetraurelia]|uniref:Bromo domain-containing protein n=1 Tax=Paramecium tetraurelia TaxID=5888 RepID=A0DR12_PARTE|nr:uncharacterized protein GSPATT00002880001 [Paramecium tetraurelia]CAK85479.1 unnamed protein product [Paramecium tetraurelia]|eukprot:XP_001452876.1 hypothetical protein (macronuclear) [Paramecium tetraurelia strain d4-2]